MEKWHTQKWDPRTGAFDGTHLVGDTRDLRPDTLKVRPETRDLVSNSSVGPGTLKVVLETWNPGHLFYMILRSENQDTERRIWDTHDRWDPRPKANIYCGTWNARTMIQIT